MCHFGRGYQGEQFCEIILKLDHWFSRRYLLKIFHIWSYGGPFVQWSGTICAILVEGIMRAFLEIILNLDQWFRWRCRLKTFLIWSSGGPFVHRSETICATLVEDIMRNNSVNYMCTCM